MSPRLRLAVLGIALLALVPGAAATITHLPEFGATIAAYGERINAITPGERHVANMVSAINFDLRGLDTLGEEFMLLAAITGTVVLLRGRRGETITDRAMRLPGRAILPRSEAVQLTSRLVGPLLMLFGVYVVVHATVTPGGGFQGGVILASGTLLAYLGEGYDGWRDMVRSHWLDAMEGGGAFLFTLCGLAPMLTGAAFMQNVLPLGTFRDVFSGGLMLVENAGVALAVCGGFTQLFLEFLRKRGRPTAPRNRERTAHDLAALRRRRMALRHRPLWARLEPQPDPPRGLPLGLPIGHLRAAPGTRLSLGQHRPDLLRSSSGHPGGRSGDAGAGAHRHRRRCHAQRAPARADGAGLQAQRHPRPGAAQADGPPGRLGWRPGETPHEGTGAMMASLFQSWPTEVLVPLPVALPLLVCAAMLATAHLLPGRLPDILATLTALVAAGLSAIIALRAGDGSVDYWFGGWQPRDGIALGIGFSVSAAGGWIGAFIGFLYACTFVFAWGFFARTHGHFHILMLLFLAAMLGFCFTRDLFNLFVWFEVMSVAAFALTAYHLARSAITGAINFTVVNSLAGFLMLGGIGLLYARTETLDFAGIAQGVAHAGRDPVVAGDSASSPPP